MRALTGAGEYPSGLTLATASLNAGIPPWRTRSRRQRRARLAQILELFEWTGFLA